VKVSVPIQFKVIYFRISINILNIIFWEVVVTCVSLQLSKSGDGLKQEGTKIKVSNIM
jgi:hypothetical protein